MSGVVGEGLTILSAPSVNEAIPAIDTIIAGATENYTTEAENLLSWGEPCAEYESATKRFGRNVSRVAANALETSVGAVLYGLDKLGGVFRNHRGVLVTTAKVLVPIAPAVALTACNVVEHDVEQQGLSTAEFAFAELLEKGVDTVAFDFPFSFDSEEQEVAFSAAMGSALTSEFNDWQYPNGEPEDGGITVLASTYVDEDRVSAEADPQPRPPTIYVGKDDALSEAIKRGEYDEVARAIVDGLKSDPNGKKFNVVIDDETGDFVVKPTEPAESNTAFEYTDAVTSETVIIPVTVPPIGSSTAQPNTSSVTSSSSQLASSVTQTVPPSASPAEQVTTRATTSTASEAQPNLSGYPNTLKSADINYVIPQGAGGFRKEFKYDRFSDAPVFSITNNQGKKMVVRLRPADRNNPKQSYADIYTDSDGNGTWEHQCVMKCAVTSDSSLGVYEGSTDILLDSNPKKSSNTNAYIDIIQIYWAKEYGVAMITGGITQAIPHSEYSRLQKASSGIHIAQNANGASAAYYK